VLRLFLVGHFGIVSFGGTNMAGIALNPAMFSKTTVDILPSPELKAIGRSIIERREELIDRSRRDAKFRGEDPAVRIHEVLDAEKFKLGGSFSDWVQCYNVNIWDVARPAVATSLGYQQQVLTPTQSKEVDGILAQLSSCAISANCMLYVRYVSGSLAYSLNRSVRQEKWSARLMTVLLAMLLFFSGVLAALLLGRSGFLPFRSVVCLTMAMVCASAVLWEDVSGMTFYIWGWVPGTISPELLPVVAVFYGLFSGGSYLLVGYSRVFNDAQFSRDHAAACCSAYCFGVMLLVSLVEAPLDRYLMTAWPVMCSVSAAMLGLAVQRLLQGLRLHIVNRY
jgi:hypothetical protein